MIFFTDLDGTIIRSASRKREGDIVVEYKDGCEITCISSESAKRLAELSDTGSIIPITSRSIEQYKRIVIPGFMPRYAIADNGGNLLVNGVPDKEWAAWSSKIAEERGAELENCRILLEDDPDRSFEVRLVDGLFLFTKSGDPEQTLKRLRKAAEGLELYNTGAKVYAIPKELNKGAAVQRLVGVLGRRGEKIVCAGDSVMDVPMLEIADIKVYPDDMGLETGGFTCPRGVFCEFVVNKAAEFLR